MNSLAFKVMVAPGSKLSPLTSVKISCSLWSVMLIPVLDKNLFSVAISTKPSPLMSTSLNKSNFDTSQFCSSFEATFSI